MLRRCDKHGAGHTEGPAGSRVHEGGQLLPGRAVSHLLFTARHPGLRPQPRALTQGLLSHMEFTCPLLCGKQTCQDEHFFTSTYFCTLDVACLVFPVNPHNSNEISWSDAYPAPSILLFFFFYLSVYLIPLLYSKTLNSVQVS